MMNAELCLDEVMEKYRPVVEVMYGLGNGILPGERAGKEAVRLINELTFKPLRNKKEHEETWSMQCEEAACISVAFELNKEKTEQYNADGDNKWTLPKIKDELAVWTLWVILDLEYIADRKESYCIAYGMLVSMAYESILTEVAG